MRRHTHAFLMMAAVVLLGSCDAVSNSAEEASVHDPLVLPDVHDPAQLVRVGGALHLYASPVEWWTYSLDDRDWYFLGDDLYDGNNPDWDLGDAAYWAPSIVQGAEDRYRLYHSAVHDEANHGSRAVIRLVMYCRVVQAIAIFRSLNDTRRPVGGVPQVPVRVVAVVEIVTEEVPVAIIQAVGPPFDGACIEMQRTPHPNQLGRIVYVRQNEWVVH